MSLYRIMYISTATAFIPVDDCQALAQASAVNNVRCDVTGLLLFNSKRFLQVLEGPHDAVKETFARIHADPRHFGVVILRDGPVEAREFGQWGMAFDDCLRPANALRDKVQALLTQAGPSTRAHFIGTAEMHRAA